MIKIKLPFVKGKTAIALGRLVFLSESAYNDPKVIAHEEEHIRQMKREGFILFTLKYIYYNWKYGYANNPYECLAREQEKEVI